MPACSVSGCGNYNRNTKGTDVRYYSFPKNEDLLRQWINACKRENKINLKNACIFSTHFAPSSFGVSLRHQLLNYISKNTRDLKEDAVPTLNLPGTTQNSNILGRQRRRKRLSKTDVVPVFVAIKTENDEVCDDLLFSEKIAEVDPLRTSYENEILELKKRVLTLEKEKTDLSNRMSEMEKKQNHMEVVLENIFSSQTKKKSIRKVKIRDRV